MIRHCFDEFLEHKSEETAAECLRCLKENAEEFYFDEQLKRIKLAKELWDSEPKKIMEELSKYLNVTDRTSFIKIRDKYNLIIY